MFRVEVADCLDRCRFALFEFLKHHVLLGMVAAIRVALEVDDNGLQDFVIRSFGALEYRDFLLESFKEQLEISVVLA
jgi:hypothetical protein